MGLMVFKSNEKVIKLTTLVTIQAKAWPRWLLWQSKKIQTFLFVCLFWQIFCKKCMNIHQIETKYIH